MTFPYMLWLGQTRASSTQGLSQEGPASRRLAFPVKSLPVSCHCQMPPHTRVTHSFWSAQNCLRVKNKCLASQEAPHSSGNWTSLPVPPQVLTVVPHSGSPIAGVPQVLGKPVGHGSLENQNAGFGECREAKSLVGS